MKHISNNGWAVGSNGTIITTSNGGVSWTSNSSGISNYLFSVYFVDSSIGWISGSNGILLKTTDGGSTWTAKTSGTNTWLRSLYFKDSNTGWVVGNDGIILMTEDGGDTWSARKSFTSNTLSSVIFADDTTGWVVGEAGTVLKMTMAELFTSIEDEPLINSPIPQTFELRQNYPNPFNPTTKIKYELQNAGKVKIEVFNLLGQRIKTLINKQMPAGSHEVEFTAKNLPSAVYLYRIVVDSFGEAGEFQQVRKMILMK